LRRRLLKNERIAPRRQQAPAQLNAALVANSFGAYGIERRRMPVVEGKSLKIIEKSRKKIMHVPDGLRRHLTHLVWLTPLS